MTNPDEITDDSTKKPRHSNTNVIDPDVSGIAVSKPSFVNESLVYVWTPVTESFLNWLKAETVNIVQEWVERLAILSPSYLRSTRNELMQTVSEAFAANLEYISSGRLDRIQKFIDFITEKRLKAGFSLSDVQKAFELFRLVVLDRLRSPGPFQPPCNVSRTNKRLPVLYHSQVLGPLPTHARIVHKETRKKSRTRHKCADCRTGSE